MHLYYTKSNEVNIPFLGVQKHTLHKKYVNTIMFYVLSRRKDLSFLPYYAWKWLQV